jgi:hypothetical protein
MGEWWAAYPVWTPFFQPGKWLDEINKERCLTFKPGWMGRLVWLLEHF